MSRFSPADFLAVSLARQISDGSTVATGVLSWLPMLAIALAQATRAPRLRYFNCAGAINPPLRPFPASSTAGSLLRENPCALELTELWDLAATHKLDVMFFGFAQLDRLGRTNLTRLNTQNCHPRKLAGVAGALALRRLVNQPMLFCPRHSRSSFVHRVDAVTTRPSPAPVRVITNLGVFSLEKGALAVSSLHPGVSPTDLRLRTGFPVLLPRRWPRTPAPSPAEQRALAELDPQKIRDRVVRS